MNNNDMINDNTGIDPTSVPTDDGIKDPANMDILDDIPMGIKIFESADPFEEEVDVMELLEDLSVKPAMAQFRDQVINQIMSVLIGRDKPNALLVGPAGCGKTQIVEALAYMITHETDTSDLPVPDILRGYKIYSANLSDIVSGTGLVGSLETKVRTLIDFFEDTDNRAILFLDEVHMLFGGSDAYNKIAQILKPVLSRGRIKVIAATTTQEVKRIDKDPAFNRRFTRVLVDELTKEQTVTILKPYIRNSFEHYGTHFSIHASVERAIVEIADEFCSAGSHRPDNALTLLDRTMAETKLRFPRKRNILITTEMVEETAMKMSSGNSVINKFSEQSLRRDLSVIQGQNEVLEDFIKVIRLHDMHIRPWKKPLTFLFAGPSGVGKTEVTGILARNYIKEKPIILNMAEYHSASSINRIIGAPAGYVGSDSNAELPFDTLESNPYQVILLDEFEKCDRSVQRLFMSVFDEGVLKTNRGNTIDFSKSIIIATTNACCTDRKNHIGFATTADKEGLSVSDLSEYFDIELINRFSHRYTFNSISKTVYRDILADIYKRERAQLSIERLRRSKYLPPELDANTLDRLVEGSYDPALGARPARTAVTEYIDNMILKISEIKMKKKAKMAGNAVRLYEMETTTHR